MKKVAKAIIMNRLQARFKLQELTPEMFSLIESIIPITNVDDLLKSTGGGTVTGTATDRSDAYTVPSGKRWTLKSALCFRSNAGTMTLYIDTDDGTYIADRSVATATLINFETRDIKLDEGKAVTITFSTGTSGALTSHVIYEEEDAF